MLSLRPETVAAYDSPSGALVLAVGGGVSFAAYRVMLRIARLPTEERVLR
jgi:tight adherence protein B